MNQFLGRVSGIDDPLTPWRVNTGRLNPWRPCNSRAKCSLSGTSPAACAKASNTGPMLRRSSGGIFCITAAIAARRCSMTFSTNARPCLLSASSRYRRSAGLSLRSSKPAETSRSQVRVALEGWTPKSAATAPRFCGPWESINTSTRSCGEVTRCSTSATDWAITARNTRAARIAASISLRASAARASAARTSALSPPISVLPLAGTGLFFGFTLLSMHPLLARVQCLRGANHLRFPVHLGTDLGPTLSGLL